MSPAVPLDIVVGLVLRDDGRFLIQPRTGDPAMAGLWELPGGKVEPGEDPRAALAREVAEEAGLEVRVEDEPIWAACHVYPDRRVALRLHRCEPVGEPRATGRSRWVTTSEYASMPMPEANVAIVAALRRWTSA